MRSALVLDSWAILAWLGGEEPAAGIVQGMLDASERTGRRPAVSVINVGEVLYSIVRSRGASTATATRDALLEIPMDRVPVDEDLVWEAATLKASFPISYADAFCAALAVRLDARVVTGDPEFRALEEARVLKVRWLARGGR